MDFEELALWSAHIATFAMDEERRFGILTAVVYNSVPRNESGSPEEFFPRLARREAIADALRLDAAAAAGEEGQSAIAEAEGQYKLGLMAYAAAAGGGKAVARA